MDQKNTLDLYIILNIDQNIILTKQNNVNYYLANSEVGIGEITQAIGYIEKFHSYFHFEQSFCYLLLAYIYHHQSDANTRDEYLEKSIFQDHYNIQALDFRNGFESNIDEILLYDKHHRYEADFLNFAVGPHDTPKEVELLDDIITKLYELKTQEAKKLLEKLNYNSHRVQVAKGLLKLYSQQEADAVNFFQQACKNLESKHRQYHQYAASIYKKRAQLFFKSQLIELGKNDLVKAKNLFPE
ncbi:MAG: hypothetical protein K9G11_03500 [Rickettsiaceae bacterium]|nr:hypothetical protein [Rickettsiaceae bacterium]